MKQTIFVILLILIFNSFATSQVYLSGEVNGTLIDTVYIITDDIVVSSSLNILPGARLLFNQGTHFQINGNLQANGTQQDSIYFVLNEGASSWGGLDFGQWSGYGHHLHYCVISGSNSSGVTLEEATISSNISNCLFTNNSATGYGGGIYASCTHINDLDSCTFINNDDYALYLEGCFILDNLITHLYLDGNEGGIYNISYELTFDDCIIINNDSPIAGGGFRDRGASNTIKNSLIAYNSSSSSGGGILTYGRLTVDKCTIVHNETGGYGGGMSFGTHIVLKNSIIAYNEGVYGLDGVWITNERDIISHNLFFENELADIYMIDPDEIEFFEPDSINLNGDPCDSYSNLYLDPQFVDYLTDFHLSDSSPCINAGDPASPTDPDGTITDIGLFAYNQNFINPDRNTKFPTSLQILSMYPNPFNSSARLIVNIDQPSLLAINVYNILGKKIVHVNEGFYQSGQHAILINGCHLPSGEVFITVDSNGKRLAVQKALLIK